MDKPEIKTCKKFMDYYKDPEYKKKHLAYIGEKITCDGCGRSFKRCNKARHIRSNIHKRHTEEGLHDIVKRMQEEIEELKQKTKNK